MELAPAVPPKVNPKYFLHNPRYNSWQVQFKNQVNLPLDQIKTQFSKYGEVIKVVQRDYLGMCFVHFKTRDAARICVLGLRNLASINLIPFKQEFRGNNSNNNSRESCENNLNDSSKTLSSVDKSAFNTSNGMNFDSFEEPKNHKLSHIESVIKDNDQALKKPIARDIPVIKNSSNSMNHSNKTETLNLPHENAINGKVYTSTPVKLPIDDLNVNKPNLPRTKPIYPKPMKNLPLRPINNNSMNGTVAPAKPISSNQELTKSEQNGMTNGFGNHDGHKIVTSEQNFRKTVKTDQLNGFKNDEMMSSAPSCSKLMKSQESNHCNKESASVSMTSGHPMLQKTVNQDSNVHENNFVRQSTTLNEQNFTKLLKKQESNGLKNDSGIELTQDLSLNLSTLKMPEKSADNLGPNDFCSSDISLTPTESTCPSSPRSHSSKDADNICRDTEDHSRSSEDNSTGTENNQLAIYQPIPAGLPDLVKKPLPPQKPMDIVFPAPTPMMPPMPMMHPMMHSMYPRPNPTRPFVRMNRPLHDVVVANIHEFCCTEFILDMLVDYQPTCASKVDSAPPYNIRFCYVYFDSKEKAEAVEQNFDNAEVFGKNLIVLRSTTLAAQAEGKRGTRRFNH